MNTIDVQIQGSTFRFHVNSDENYFPECAEDIGNYRATFKCPKIVNTAEEIPVVYYNSFGDPTTPEILIENFQEIMKGEEYDISNPDEMMSLVTALMGEDQNDDDVWEFWVDADGSMLWLFHDLAHAINDFSLHEGRVYGPEQTLTAFHEDRAHTTGASLAVECGALTMKQCIAELIRANPSFQERFGTASEAAINLLETL